MSDIGLSIAGSGLAADSAEIDTISNNLANIDTPGYAAEQVNLSPEASNGQYGAGQGVLIGSITNLTDAVFAAANVAAQGTSSGTNQFSQELEDKLRNKNTAARREPDEDSSKSEEDKQSAMVQVKELERKLREN